MAAKWDNFKKAIKNDVNLNRARRGIGRGIKALPAATGRYFVQKTPIVKWVPNYEAKWLVDDAIAGVTMGMMLIPQAIASALLAGIPLQQGLLAAWLPHLIYAIMGTSKDMSTGPSPIVSILTGKIVADLGVFKIPATIVATGVAFSVGILSLLMGLFNLGWLLDFVSLPILVGFMVAAAVITAQAQVPALLGILGVSNDFIESGKDIIMKLKDTEPLTVAIGFSGIALLIILQVMGSKLGKKHVVISTLASSRYVIVLIMYTGISYSVNKDRLIPMWRVAGTIEQGLKAPAQPSNWLLVLAVLTKSFPVFFATALEHLAVAKAMGRQNGYTIDPSQELTYLGVTNIANGFFGGMPVGGTLSRTAVNSSANVRSPLSGIFTMTVVLLGLHVLNNAFFYIPQATIAAIVIVATLQVIPPVAVMKGHWKGSFIDFVSCQLVTQISLLRGLETGTSLGMFFITIYTLLRLLFGKVDVVDSSELYRRYGMDDTRRAAVVQSGMCVVRLEDSVFFLNAFRIKRNILRKIRKEFPMIQNNQKDRKWNEKKEKRLMEDMYPMANSSRALRVLVLDFSLVSFVDTTTMTMLLDLKAEISRFTDQGEEAELRFVGLCAPVKEKFERTGWKMADGNAAGGGDGLEGDRVFDELRCAIQFPVLRRASANGEWNFGFDEKNREVGEKDGVVAAVRYIGF